MEQVRLNVGEAKDAVAALGEQAPRLPCYVIQHDIVYFLLCYITNYYIRQSNLLYCIVLYCIILDYLNYII